jgi:predicted DNA-binding transcriptional regulator AlpA
MIDTVAPPGEVSRGGQGIELTREKQPVDFPRLSTGKRTSLARVAANPERVLPGQKTGPAYPPRAMRAEQAAGYLSMSRSMWLKLVEEGKMPKPIKIGAMTTWDRYDIDDAFEDLKRGNGEPSENTVHRRLRELADDRRKNGSPD